MVGAYGEGAAEEAGQHCVASQSNSACSETLAQSETVWDPDSQELGTQRLEEFNDWPDRQPDSGQIGHLLEVDLAEQDLISGVITEEEEEQRPCLVQPA